MRHGEALTQQLHGCPGLGVQACECQQADLDGWARVHLVHEVLLHQGEIGGSNPTGVTTDLHGKILSVDPSLRGVFSHSPPRQLSVQVAFIMSACSKGL